MYAITLREAFYQIVFVLPDSLDKIRGNAGVQGSVAFARHDIYARLIHLLIPLDRGSSMPPVLKHYGAGSAWC